MALLVACSAPAAFAQSTGDEYNKVEFFGGYSHNRVDTGVSNEDPEFDDIFDEREGFNGVNASITGNVSRYVGLKFDYSYHQRSIEFGTDSTNFRLQNFLGGVQIKDNTKDSEKVVKPFVHFLAGAARASVDLTEFDDSLEDVSETGFAAAIGGGLDVRVHPRVDIRAFQFDYNPNRFDGEMSHNFRIGVGIVIH